jgi:hypothetical protein
MNSNAQGGAAGSAGGAAFVALRNGSEHPLTAVGERHL